MEEEDGRGTLHIEVAWQVKPGDLAQSLCLRPAAHAAGKDVPPAGLKIRSIGGRRRQRSNGVTLL